jgi:hypothetical protein
MDDTQKISRSDLPSPKDPFDREEVVATARAAAEVIRVLKDYMAMPDERATAAAEAVLRRLDKLSEAE